MVCHQTFSTCQSSFLNEDSASCGKVRKFFTSHRSYWVAVLAFGFFCLIVIHGHYPAFRILDLSVLLQHKTKPTFDGRNVTIPCLAPQGKPPSFDSMTKAFFKKPTSSAYTKCTDRTNLTTMPWSKPKWHKVTRTISTYSAHIVGKSFNASKEIHIIGIVPSKQQTPLLHGTECACKLFSGNEEFVLVQVKLHYPTHFDIHPLPFRNVRFICSPFSRKRLLVTKVQLICIYDGKCGSVAYSLSDAPMQKPMKLSFALCGPAIWLDMNPLLVIEFLEYYKLLGVTQFYFYAYKLGDAYKAVFAQYKNMVTIMEWNLHMPTDKIHYFGQLAALNDCIERTTPVYDYTITVDIDEFIILNDGKVLEDLVRYGELDCVIFQSSGMKVTDAELDAHNTCQNEIMLANTMRSEYVFPMPIRTKHLCRGSKVRSAGIHFPHYTTPGTIMHAADINSEGMVFHYRMGMEPQNKTVRYVNDTRSLDLVETLRESVVRIAHALHLLDQCEGRGFLTTLNSSVSLNTV